MPRDVAIKYQANAGKVADQQHRRLTGHMFLRNKLSYDDDCFYYHSWRNNVVIAFGTLSSFLT